MSALHPELAVFEKEWSEQHRKAEQFTQLAIGDNGKQLWKRLVMNRQEALQNVKQLVSDHSYLIHFADYVSTPNNPLSAAIQNWERHLYEAAE